MINTSTLVPTGASRIPNWVSGGSYVIGDQSISPITLKEYIRRTNGGGATDPSADPTNWQLMAASSTKTIASFFSSAGYNPIAIVSATAFGAASSLSGSLTANTLSTVLNITGSSGIISHFTIRAVDATARTIRTVVTIDGVSIYDVTSGSNATADRGVVLAGVAASTSSVMIPQIIFTSSIKIEVASNLTETGKFNIEHIYQTRG